MFISFGLTNAVFSALTYFIINELGRRTLLLWSLGLMFPFLIATGHFLNVRNNGSPPVAPVMALVLIYTAIYSPGAGVIPFMYASEVFPLVHREAGMSLAVSVNFALAGALTMAVPISAKTGNQFALLGSFAGLDGLAAIGVWLFMRSPERALSLEDMNYLFLPPLSSYVRYQAAVALPWAFRWLFPKSLYGSESKQTFGEWYQGRANERRASQQPESGRELD